MASPGNQHCANCIGTLSFPMRRVMARSHRMLCVALRCGAARRVASFRNMPATACRNTTRRNIPHY